MKTVTFVEFFESTYPGVLASALMLCGHRQDAEDAVQEAYFEALQRWERIGGYEAPEAWVRKIMRQRLWGTAQQRSRQTSSTLELDLVVSPLAGPEQTAEVRAVLSALGALPGKLRFVMVRHCLDGVKQEDLALQLGLKRATIAFHIRTARRLLETSLGMVPAGRRGEDSLLPASGAQVRLAYSITDPLAACLRDSEQWLRESLAEDPEITRRARARLAERVRPPDPARSKWAPWRRRAPRQGQGREHNAESDQDSDQNGDGDE